MEAPPLAISTHYYKLAHLKAISYAIYLSPDGNDQRLLETELELRYRHPRCLLTYNNKCLFYFLVTPEVIDLEQEFPGAVKLKHRATVPVARFTAPLKSPPPPGTPQHPNEVYLPFAHIAFVKAVKKMIMYMLSLHHQVHLFGNYGVLVDDGRIVYIDPILFATGDLVVLILQKDRPRLEPSLVIDWQTYGEVNFVIYTIPTAIRCHLCDPRSLAANVVTKNDHNNVDVILNLIRLATGRTYDDPSLIVWIKLVPNLKQWNNQTSTIAKFIHTIDNRKCILWPWDMCLLQFGVMEPFVPPHPRRPLTDAAPLVPLTLMLEFIDFNINHSHRRMSLTQPQQPPTLGLAPGSITMPRLVDVTPIVPEMFLGGDLFGDNASHPGSLPPAEIPPATDPLQLVPEPHPLDDSMDIDDLFGGEDAINAAKSADTDGLFNLFGGDDDDATATGAAGAAGAGDVNAGADATIPPPLAEDVANDVGDDTKPFSGPENLLPVDREDLKRQLPQLVVEQIIDIPRDKMTITKDSKETPGYRDPGAPVPIMFTPNLAHIPQSLTATNGSPLVVSRHPPPPPPSFQPGPLDRSGSEEKLAFSPILFNPIIQSNIDTKYGKGGKFYVDKAEKAVDEPHKRRELIRETLVLGMGPFDDKPKRELPEVILDIEDLSESDADDVDDTTNAAEDWFNRTLGIPEFQGVAATTTSGQVAPPSPPYKLPDMPFLFQQFDTPRSAKDLTKAGQSGLAYLGSPGVRSFGLLAKELPFDSVTPPVIEVEETEAPGDIGDNDGATVTAGTGAGTGAGAGGDNDAMVVDGDPDVVILKEKQEQLMALAPELSLNYLPFILRSANVSTIPPRFLLNNQREVPTNYNIDDDGIQTDDFDPLKQDQMVVLAQNVDVLLKYLHELLIFDLNLNSKQHPDQLVYSMPPASFFDQWFSVFPQSYRMLLLEFLDGFQPPESLELDEQIDFLGDITTGYDDGCNDDSGEGVFVSLTSGVTNIKRLLRKLNKFEWEGILGTSDDQYQDYTGVLTQLLAPLLSDDWELGEEQIQSLPVTKVRLKKNEETINLNSFALPFWNYLNFSPIMPPKKFQVVAIGRSTPDNSLYLQDFVTEVVNNYHESNLGSITRVNLLPDESHLDLESINQGVITVDDDDILLVRRRLSQLVELIKLDLINKTNNFEFDRPLLVLFVNFQENNYNSLLQIAKVFRDFKVSLLRHQLPLVKFFTKVVPALYVVKQNPDGFCRLRPFSNIKLTKLSLNLYTICPNAGYTLDEVEPRYGNNLYTHIVRDPPQRIQFKFMQQHQSAKGTKSLFNDDIFLHLAFDRSLDKHWISCAWSDPLGLVNLTKLWYCSGQKQIGEIIDEIWLILMDFCKRINDELYNKTSLLGGKRFLVLTRINLIILDDELVHWKRLTTKHKEMGLIVLLVSRSTLDTFSVLSTPDDEDPEVPKSDASVLIDRDTFFRQFNNRLTETLPSTLVTSPNFHSPQQFLNAPAGFFSPQDTQVPTNGGTPTLGNTGALPTSDILLHDPSTDIWAIIPHSPIPSLNSPLKLGMRMGYLAKEDDDKMVVFEVSLLLCPSFWLLDNLMQIILKQYKLLVLMNDILGLNGEGKAEELVPWHIKAVGKVLDYLVNVYVE